MASPQETALQPAGDRAQEAVRRARLHLTEAGNVLDSAATARTRASELAGERASVADELAEDIAAVRGSARMLVDVLSE
jgi:hypothetical protein